MRAIIRRLVGVFAAGVLAISATATVAANTEDFAITISGGFEHEVGDTITVTSQGDYVVPAGGQCYYTLAIEQDLDPESPFSQLLSTADSFHYFASGDGQCPEWTFRLPNPNTMIATTPGEPVSVRVTVSAQGGSVNAGDYIQESAAATITFNPSSATVAPASTLPLLLWSLDPVRSATGQTVTVQPFPVGFPAGWPDSETGGSDAHGDSLRYNVYSLDENGLAGNPTPLVEVSPLDPISFNQTLYGTTINLVGDMAGNGTVAQSTVNAIDPPVQTTDPTPPPVTETPTSVEPTPGPVTSMTPPAEPSATPSMEATSPTAALPDTSMSGGADMASASLMLIVGFMVAYFTVALRAGRCRPDRQ